MCLTDTNALVIEEELKLVEKYILENIKTRNKLLQNAVNDLVEAGGKRLRPTFVIISAAFGTYNREKVISVAGAIEILHTATLVHDDIVDSSDTRRGRKTISKKFGFEMAVYAGDFLFTKAILMISKDIPLDNLSIVANALKVICEGEVDQLISRYDFDTSVLSYLKRIRRKTAILFSASCALGGYVSNLETKYIKALTKFGLCFGTAFQIKDDLKDYISCEEKEGKPVGKDLKEGNITLPLIYAIKNSTALKSELKNHFKNKMFFDIKDVAIFSDIIKERSGVESAQSLMEKYIKKGLKELDVLPDNQYKVVLENFINSLRL